MKKITVVVGPTGETTVTTTGFQGKGCQDATKQLERAMGLVKSDKKTPEFYNQAGTSAQANQ